MKREEEESTARKQKLLRGLADQHILRGDPVGLVQTQEVLLRLDGLTGTDLYHALRDWGIERFRDGERLGTRFDLRVAAAAFDHCAPLAPNEEWRGWSLNDLGIALRVLGERGDTVALHRAIAAYEAALEVNTLQDMPADWAMTRGNMADAYRALAEVQADKAADHIATGLAAVDDALSILTEDKAKPFFDFYTDVRTRLLTLRDTP